MQVARRLRPRSPRTWAIVPDTAFEDVTFTDVTKGSGITFSHVSSPDKKYILESMSGGVAVFDFDKDGLLDVYLVNAPTVATAGDRRSARSELWRNRGDGTFVDVTDKAGVGYPGWGMGAVAADFDNDGWDDLYVTCYGPNHLYRNNGDGTFSDVTAKAGVGDPGGPPARRSRTTTAMDGSTCSSPTTSTCGSTRCPSSARASTASSTAFRCSAAREGCAALATRSTATRAMARSRTSRARPACPIPAGASAWVSSGATSTATARGSFRRQRCRPELPVQEQWRRHLRRRGAAGGDRAQRGWQRAGLDGCGRRRLRPLGRLEHLRHEFFRRIQRPLSARQGLPVQRRVLCSQTAKASIPLVGWGTHFLDYDNDGWLDLLVVNGHVYPQVERAGLAARYAQRKLLYRNNRNGTFTDATSTAVLR